MSTVTTAKPIDPTQLAAELGVGVAVADDGTTRTVTAEVTQIALQAAVDAHVPEPPPPSPIAALQQQISELTDLILFGF